MATATLVPIADKTTQWETVSPGPEHYGAIDEGVASADDDDYVETELNLQNERYYLGAPPPNVKLATEASVTIRGKIVDPAQQAYIQVRIYHSGTVQIGIKNITGSDLGGYGVLGVATVTWPGLALTQAEVDAMEVRLISFF